MQLQFVLDEGITVLTRRLLQLSEKLMDNSQGDAVLEEIMEHSGLCKTVAAINVVKLAFETDMTPFLIVDFTYDNRYTDTFYIRCTPSNFLGSLLKIGD